MVLGEALMPGEDDEHFCKPTDVAVESSGVFYVADGFVYSSALSIHPTSMSDLGWYVTFMLIHVVCQQLWQFFCV